MSSAGFDIRALLAGGSDPRVAKGLYEVPSPDRLRAEMRKQRGRIQAGPGSLWNGPPLAKLHVKGCPLDLQTCIYMGCVPFTGVLVAASRGFTDNTVGVNLGAGGTIRVGVGDPNAGETDHRICGIGPGHPVFLSLGSYAHASVEVMRLANAAAFPARLTWCDSPVGASGEPDLLRFPAFLQGAGAGNEQFVPNGARRLWVEAANTLTWRDWPTGGAFVLTEAVVAGQTVDVKGETLALLNQSNLVYFLKPL